MVMRYLQNYSKIGLEVGAPDHGPRADGRVEGADSGLKGEKLHVRAQGGPEPARLDNKFLKSIQNNCKIFKTIVKYQLNKFKTGFNMTNFLRNNSRQAHFFRQ